MTTSLSPQPRTQTPPSPALRPVGLLLGLVLLLSACARPEVAVSLDQVVCPSDGGACAPPPRAGVIRGQLATTGSARGDAILLLFAADDLPPPDGTASTALALSRIPAAQLFASAGVSSGGPFSAPFLFTQVAPGRYQIRAFLDLPGDFDPFADFTLSPRAGAPLGGSVAPGGSGLQLASFSVPENGAVDVSVALGAASPFDPPAFTYAPGSPTSLPADFDRPQLLTLKSIDPGVAHARFSAARFAIELRPGPDGLPAYPDGDGLPDVFPQLLLRQLTARGADGAQTPIDAAHAAIVPCKVQPTRWLPLLLAGLPPIPAEELPVLAQPFAVRLDAAGAPAPLPAIPAGEYQLVVIEKSGQVWTVPNSLGDGAFGPAYRVPSQAQRVTFTPPASRPGSISGRIVLPAGRKPGNLIVQAYAGGPAFAPPNLAAQPARVRLLPARFTQVDPAERSVPFTIDGLPKGTYALLALEDGDGNFNGLRLGQTATRGDLVGAALDGLGAVRAIDVQGPVTDVTVTLVAAPGQDGQGAGTALDPPAFEVELPQGQAAPPGFALDATSTLRLDLRAAPIAFPLGAGRADATTFTVSLVRDALGRPVDADHDGLPDVWPKVFVALAASTTLLAAAVDPTPFLPALLAGGRDLVLPAGRVSIVVRPVALDASNPAAPRRLLAMPAGDYAILLLNRTGQVWQIPNEAAPAALDPAAVCADVCRAGQVSTAGQGITLRVRPPAAQAPGGGISGTLTVSGTSTIVSAVLFAHRADDPPPPFGTGRPVAADLLLGADFAPASAGTAGRSAPFALRGLPPGSYVATAIVDTRGDLALDPPIFALAPGQGSLAAAALDASGQGLAPIQVAASLVAGVQVLAPAAGALAPMPPRPSFLLAGGQTVGGADLSAGFTDAVTPRRITLRTAQPLDGRADALATELAPPQFTVAYRGCATSSPAALAADANQDGLPDLWPQLFVQRLSDGDPTGLTPDPAGLFIPAAVDPAPFVPLLGPCGSRGQVQRTEVDVLLSPVALRRLADGSLQQQPIPPGRYGVTLVARSGQVWRLPNELQPALLDPRSAATPAGGALASQGAALRVAETVPAASPGAIRGSVRLTSFGAGPAGQAGALFVAAWDAARLPPPLGSGTPVALRRFPSAAVAAALGGSLPFRLGDLPPGRYVVAALLDPLGQVQPQLDFASGLPRGGQLAFYSGGGAGPLPVTVGASDVPLPEIVLDRTATRAVPSERPAFRVDPAGSQASISARAAPGAAGSSALLNLLPAAPDGLPYVAAGPPAFHPTPALDPLGNPRRAALGAGCLGTLNQPWISTQAVVAPLDTSQPIGPAVAVDACQFCAALTGTADCSAGLLAPPLGPAPFAGPVQVRISNEAVDLGSGLPTVAPLPPGRYSVTLVEQTGQIWTLPNDLLRVDGASGLQQGFVFQVQP